ncbi:MAG: SIS domain-containing protein [Lachnospiraceae bacterium]|nr:SIS domain-containing protein [Lachnospiraceae bacterium]
MDFTKQIREYLELEISILGKLDTDEINRAMNMLEETRQKGSSVYVFGNGGSAATASHMENDFNKGISEKLEKKYRFQCINANMATIMAIANDNGYARVFEQQLENKLKPEDVIIAISGSGNSENVIKAVEYAKKQGCRIIGMTGYSGGKLKELSDVSLHVPLDNMQITEDVHIIFNHLMMYVLCGELSGYPVH